MALETCDNVRRQPTKSTFVFVMAGNGDAARRRWPGLVDEAYPEVFTTIPKQKEQLKQGQLGQKS